MLTQDIDFIDEVVFAVDSLQSDILIAERIKRLVGERIRQKEMEDKVTDNRIANIFVGSDR